VQTPDDLFLSDGSWGYYDAAPSTQVTQYTVETNTEGLNTDDYNIERNITLKATTSEYIAAYRSITPKFDAVDLTNYSTFKFEAKGTGTLIVRLVKEGIADWQEQYKTSVELTNDLTSFELGFSEFKSTNGTDLEANDVTSIVFTMLAENGEEVSKEMIIKQLSFSESNSLSVSDLLVAEGAPTTAVPNPMKNETSIQFIAEVTENIELLVYNQLGGLVDKIEFNAVPGENEIIFERKSLSNGIYFCKIKSNVTDYKTTKLLLE